MVEIKRNQAGFILYIQGRANPPRLERFVTFWSFPRSNQIKVKVYSFHQPHLIFQDKEAFKVATLEQKQLGYRLLSWRRDFKHQLS